MTKRSIILIVDDHEMLRKTLYDWLMIAMQPCRVIEAESAESALNVLKENIPDIIIMDIGLPGMNGIEATQEIKSLFPDMMVIMLSTYEESVYKDEATRAGAIAYVTKREMRRDLIPILKQTLDKKQKIISKQYIASDQ